tara:strand:+ start:3727 stop:4815 length:1089 start_codon:yes stop_codon:yes gene_type:complete
MKKYRKILLNPGPATTTLSVKQSQIVDDICPRVSEFGNVIKEIRKDLTNIVANDIDYTTILFGGSGTASVEAVISSVISSNDNLVIINNGSYGQRIVDIAKTYKINYQEFKSELYNQVDANLLEEFIIKHKATHIVIIHNETSTGLLNNLEVLNNIIVKYNLISIIDAMSSFGAIPIDMITSNIDYLCSSSNKNLQGMAGISFVVAKKSSLELIKYYEKQTFYLDLYSQYQYLEQNNQTRFTPPVQTIYALKQAILELNTETVNGRYDRYKKLWSIINEELSKMGFKTFLNEEDQSKIITLYSLPNNIEFEKLHDYLYSYGITIYPSKFNKTSFRIANIGDLEKKDILFFLTKMNDFIDKNK